MFGFWAYLLKDMLDETQTGTKRGDFRGIIWHLGKYSTLSCFLAEKIDTTHMFALLTLVKRDS